MDWVETKETMDLCDTLSSSFKVCNWPYIKKVLLFLWELRVGDMSVLDIKSTGAVVFRGFVAVLKVLERLSEASFFISLNDLNV